MISGPLAVAPVLVGPLQTLLALLPAILFSLGGLLLALLRPSTFVAASKLLWRQKVAVAVFAGLVTGTVFAARALFPQGGPAISSEEAGGQDWPMFRGGPERRGVAGSMDGPTRGGVNWTFTADCRTFYATPAVVGNRVYVASADKGPLRDRGAIYCFDADSGGLVWKSAPAGYLATFSSPVVSGKYLACGEGLHFTRSARIVCLDLERGGEVLWTYKTNSHVESTPCIWQDRVYVGAGDDGYYCFRLEPDVGGEPVLVWHVPAEKYPDAETSPAVADGRVFVGLGMEGKGVCCLDADTGAEQWRVPTPYPVFGPPTVLGDTVIVGMGNGNFIQSAEEVRVAETAKLRKQGKTPAEIAAAERLMGPAGEVWCLDAAGGEVKWKFMAKEIILGAVAAAEDRLYFGSRDGFVYCLSPAGKELARWNAHAPIVTSPALTGSHVYVVTETGKLYGLRTADLQLAWEATVGLAGPFLSSPTVARGHVYVGSQQDGLLCLGTPGGDEEEREPVWAGYLGGPGQGGSIDGQPLPERGKLAWRFPKTAEGEATPDVAVTAPAACLKEFLFVPLHGSRNGVVCLKDDLQGNAPPKETWFAESPHGVRLSPAASSQSVWFVDGQPSDAGRHLHCVAASDGARRWKLPVEAGATGVFALADGGGFVADCAQGLACVSEEGEVAWQASIGSPVGLPAWCEAMVVATVANPPALVALDRPTGRTLWRTPLVIAPAAGPVLRAGTIYLGTADGVAAFGLADGRQRWESRGGPPADVLTVGTDRIAYVNRAGEMVLVRIEDGEVEKRLPDAVPSVPPLLTRDAILYAGKTGLMRAGLSSGDARAWMRTDWLGKFTSPVVMANSRLYFATDKRGLICAKGREK